MLFNVFINDLNDRAKCTLSKFADDIKPEGVADMPESPATIQRDLWMVAGRRNGLTRTSCSSKSVGEKSCTWKGITLCTSMC